MSEYSEIRGFQSTSWWYVPTPESKAHYLTVESKDSEEPKPINFYEAQNKIRQEIGHNPFLLWCG